MNIHDQVSQMLLILRQKRISIYVECGLKNMEERWRRDIDDINRLHGR